MNVFGGIRGQQHLDEVPIADIDIRGRPGAREVDQPPSASCSESAATWGRPAIRCARSWCTASDVICCSNDSGESMPSLRACARSGRAATGPRLGGARSISSDRMNDRFLSSRSASAISLARSSQRSNHVAAEASTSPMTRPQATSRFLARACPIDVASLAKRDSMGHSLFSEPCLCQKALKPRLTSAVAGCRLVA